MGHINWQQMLTNNYSCIKAFIRNTNKCTFDLYQYDSLIYTNEINRIFICQRCICWYQERTI